MKIQLSEEFWRVQGTMNSSFPCPILLLVTPYVNSLCAKTKKMCLNKNQANFRMTGTIPHLGNLMLNCDKQLEDHGNNI